MLLNPLSDRDSFGIDEAEEVAKTWWIFLVGGLVSLVFGALILAVDWGVDSLAAFIGALFIIEGVAWAVTVFIGIFVVVSGVIHIVGAIVNRHAPNWWLVLILGLIEVPIGIWAMRRPGLTLAVIVTLAGAWAIVTGIWQIVIAFDVRSLPRRFRGDTSAV